MVFDPIVAETRFGCGLSPVATPPSSVDAMLEGLLGPDAMARIFPIDTFDQFRMRDAESIRLKKKLRAAIGTDSEAELREQSTEYLKQVRDDWLGWIRQFMLRRAATETGFRERLAFFWADHFTAKGKRGILNRATSPYVEDAIRPHISGRFEDLLIAAATHPLMVHFLDQEKSIGPNSKVGLKRGPSVGLNENLAREILELHTLGVSAPYSQADVRQLAEALTGLGWTVDEGQRYVARHAEPGAEIVLGKWYGSKTGSLEDIHAILRDLARHPATAQHIARKLAVHFVSDTPNPSLVAAMKETYLQTQGTLTEVYRTMLTHPSAWAAGQGNAKQPVAFVSSSLRALAVQPQDFANWGRPQTIQRLTAPLVIMGQSWEDPLGPDGWAEEDDQWLTPQGMAGRLQWALRLPDFFDRDLPDPRDFVFAALGPDAPTKVAFAAKAAESRREGIALVLMSPAFLRH